MKFFSVSNFLQFRSFQIASWYLYVAAFKETSFDLSSYMPRNEQTFKGKSRFVIMDYIHWLVKGKDDFLRLKCEAKDYSGNRWEWQSTIEWDLEYYCILILVDS